MKFSIDSQEVKNIENTVNDINSIKKGCSMGSLQDFINTVNQFNDMCDDNIIYFCSKRGRIYIDNIDDNINSCREYGFDDIVAYGIEEDKLIVYTLINECHKVEYNTNGKWRYEKINK
ncbi:hypothetical protein RBU49_03030 [Clostridium sp. MB40-C1]|uniref:hypothetical protein n=1 Tax=Clostridium sp. MB40-C1 TaxID=3070996 RepID=UPI0027E135CA|nr:hypothetical protein [Clostridium sp. MB40-C1]WMJ81244.1 hypothetical protein RBU49_03030 [Clostridium sp. MB40-C1]